MHKLTQINAEARIYRQTCVFLLNISPSIEISCCYWALLFHVGIAYLCFNVRTGQNERLSETEWKVPLVPFLSLPDDFCFFFVIYTSLKPISGSCYVFLTEIVFVNNKIRILCFQEKSFRKHHALYPHHTEKHVFGTGRFTNSMA